MAFRLIGQKTGSWETVLTKEHLELYEKDTARISISYKVNWDLLILVSRMREYSQELKRNLSSNLCSMRYLTTKISYTFIKEKQTSRFSLFLIHH